MISEVAAYWGVFIFNFTSIILFAVFLFLNKILAIPKDEELQTILLTYNDQQNKNQTNPNNQSKQHDHDQEETQFLNTDLNQNNDELQIDDQQMKVINNLKQMCEDIERSLMGLFIESLWKSVAFLLTIWIFLSLWFVHHDTYFQSFLSLFFGIIVITISIFIAIRFSAITLLKTLVESKNGKGATYQSCWISSLAITGGGLSILIIIYLIFIPWCEYNYYYEGDNKQYIASTAFENLNDKEKQQHLYYALLGYPFASKTIISIQQQNKVLVVGIIMRDSAITIGAGLSLGRYFSEKLNPLHLKSEQYNHIMQKSGILAKILDINLKNTIDMQILVSYLISIVLLITCFTSLGYLKQFSVFFYPMYLFSFIVLITMVVGCIVIFERIKDKQEAVNNEENEQHIQNNVDINQKDQKSAKKLTISGYIATQIRVQFIILMSCIFFVLIFFPLFLLPDGPFAVGYRPHMPFYYGNVTTENVIICLIIGLLCSVLQIFISEYCTSNAYSPIRELEDIANQQISQGIIEINQMTMIAQMTLMLSTALVMYSTYQLGGLYGVGMGALGILSSHLFLSTISMFGGICEQGYRVSLYFAKEINTTGKLILRKISLVARNYCIFLPIINSSGIFIINFVAIGLCLIIADLLQFNLWESQTILGFLVGSLIAYFLKEKSITSIKQVYEKIIQEEKEKDDDVQNKVLLAQIEKQNKNSDYDQDKLKNEQENIKNQYKENSEIKTDQQEQNIENEIKDEKKNKIEPQIQLNVFVEGNFKRFIKSIISARINHVLINLTICTSVILLIGVLFGGRGLVGYMMGINLVGIHIVYLGYLRQQAAESIRHYYNGIIKYKYINYKTEQQNKTKIKNSVSSTNCLQLEVVMSASESNSLILYIMYNVLFVLHGIRIMSQWGWFGNYQKLNQKRLTGTDINGNQIKLESDTIDNQQEQRQVESTQAAEIEAETAESGGSSSEDLKNRLKILNQRKSLLAGQVNDLKDAINDLEQQNTDKQKALTKLQDQLSILQAEQQTVKAETQVLSEQLRQLHDFLFYLF